LDAPKAPDPTKTAAAQTQMNKDTAVTQQELNMVNQNTPFGSLSYQQTGTSASGTPQYTATQTLSPENQALYDNYMGLAGKLGDIGNVQAGNVADTLGQPFKLGNEATEARLMELGSKRLTPEFDRRRAALETQLINQGVRPGTEAYARAMEANGQQENDAYNQLLLTGRAQSANESLAERNQPLNELMAMLSGSQVQQPGFASTPQTPVSGVDYAGLVQNKYNQDVANYQAKMGGLFGLGGTALGGWAKGGFGGLPTLPGFGAFG
jgi:hypothetical protein